MNIVEKKKIEKIIISDIDVYVKNYTSKRTEEFEVLKRKFEANIPAEAKALFKKFLDTTKQAKDIENELEVMGWDVSSSYGDYKLQLAYNYRSNVEDGMSNYKYNLKELDNHNNQTSSIISKMKGLARLYTLKIYSGAKEMGELLEGLKEDIEKLMK